MSVSQLAQVLIKSYAFRKLYDALDLQIVKDASKGRNQYRFIKDLANEFREQEKVKGLL